MPANEPASTVHFEAHGYVFGSAQGGKLTLAGAGPGDPDLLTLKAHRALREAELVVADRLISPEILELVGGELKIARKFPGNAEESQQELYRWVLAGLQAGKTVVRLKGGDPFVFGRGGEEVIYFRKHGYEAEVIPGISSCVAAPLTAGIPVTMRGFADQVVVVTAVGQNNTKPEMPPYAPYRTTVILMGIGRLCELTKELIAIGYPRDVSVGVVEKGTTSSQRVVRGNLQTIYGVVKEHGIKAPATVVIGSVVDSLHQGGRGAFPWLEEAVGGDSVTGSSSPSTLSLSEGEEEERCEV